ncbi:regulatory protein RecX [Puia dinghuensis]|uniref:Regulatory protein RecX n=1 Tax=Puia dinghuensis TaxID=1792502 RepID=A0A8J2UFP1_9BACT|nr:regulatory protein RecX [Puia dinghuensis]GGB10891.1 recombinase RecX [Puia dinghuensis]
MIRRTALSLEQALQKARHYCGYQERCHFEVQEKLYSYGLRKKDVEQALATLIEENYLNEERFAIQYAGGHFRLKRWGRVRIRYELKQRQVSEYCIKKALATIDEAEYENTLNRLAEEKVASLAGEPNLFVRKQKLKEYLLRKGYEQDRVNAYFAACPPH